MATIRQRSKGVYEVRVHDPKLGKQVSRTVRGTKRDARQRADELQIEIDRKTQDPSAGLSLQEFFERDWWPQKQREIAPATLLTWRPCIDKHLIPRLGQTLLVDLTTHQIRRTWLSMQDDGIGISTINETHKILSAALGDAVRLGILDYRPTTGARLKTPKPQRETPTQAEAQAIIDAAVRLRDRVGWGPDMLCWITTVMALGIRPGEVLGLRWEAIDFTNQVVTIDRNVGKSEGSSRHVKDTKTGTVRQIPIHGSALALLADLKRTREENAAELGVDLPASAWVFGHPPLGFELFTQQTWWKRFRAVLAEAEITRKITPYSLRHWALTEVAGITGNPTTTAGFGGHADPSVTFKVYVHTKPDELRQASDQLGKVLNFPTTG